MIRLLPIRTKIWNVVMKARNASYARYWPENLPDREHAFANVLESNIVKG